MISPQTYAMLFAEWNKWYRDILGYEEAASALPSLARRTLLWTYLITQYASFYSTLCQLMILTQHAPLSKDYPRIVSIDDVRSFLQLWYLIRCDIVHANRRSDHPAFSVYVHCCQRALSLYMAELNTRRELCRKAGISEQCADVYPKQVLEQLVSAAKSSLLDPLRDTIKTV